jgi:hypothetical protein
VAIAYDSRTAGHRVQQLEVQDVHATEGRARFKRDGTSAETGFRLSDKRTSPFESVGGVNLVSR